MIKSFDGLRGIPALLIVMAHYPLLFVPGWDVSQKFIAHGYILVDLFFLMSGYVIDLNYRDRISGAKGSVMSFAEYFKRRMARLYPLYALAIFLGLIFEIARQIKHGGSADIFGYVQPLILNLFFIPDVSVHEWRPDGVIYPYCVAAWSLLCEIVVGVLYYFWVRWGQKALIPLQIGSVFAVLIGGFLLNTFDGGWLQGLSCFVGILRALAGFVIGIGLVRGQFQEIYEYFKSSSFLKFLTWGIVSGSIFYVVLGYQPNHHDLTAHLVDPIIMYFVLPLLVLMAADGRLPLMETPFSVWLGGISYSIYLLHGFILDWVELAAKYLHFEGNWLIGMSCLGLVILVSWANYHLFEVPLRQWISKLPIGDAVRARPVPAD